MTPPEVLNATQAQLDDLLAKVKATLTAQEYLLLEGVLGTFICVMLALQNARTSLRRFRKMLFGASTESKGNVLKDRAASGEPPVAGDSSTQCDPHSRTPPPTRPPPFSKLNPSNSLG